MPTLGTLTQSLMRYLATWHEPDAELRRAHLEAVWAPDGLFVDPIAELIGVDALLAHIAAFRRDTPGVTFELVSGIELHHDVFRYQWLARDARGGVVLQAFDVGQLARDGRIARLLGFFGAFPPLADPAPR